MPLPTLTEEQRKDALAKAAEARKRRAELKGQLKAEKVTLRDVLSRQSDDVVGKMKVSAVLEWFPGGASSSSPARRGSGKGPSSGASSNCDPSWCSRSRVPRGTLALVRSTA